MRAMTAALATGQPRPMEWAAGAPIGPVDATNVWAIVLAGGEGSRLRSFVRERFGQDRPKHTSDCSALERSFVKRSTGSDWGSVPSGRSS